jgi:Family of unknown function (DUF6029)
MKQYILILLGIALLTTGAYAQIDYSVNNLTRYGNGKQSVGTGSTQLLEYIETQSNVRLYLEDFTIGFQYQYDDPPEFGPKFQGVKQRFIEFNRGGLTLRAGDFYTLFGKGLSMNLFEDRAINFDTKLDGFNAVYRNKYVKAVAASGTMTYYDLIDYTHKETYQVNGGHLEVRPQKFIRIGGSYIGASGEIPSSTFVDGEAALHNVDAEIGEGMITLSGMGFDFFASYAHKTSRAKTPLGGNRFDHIESTGDGIYGNLVYTSDFGLGVTFEYKNYRFDATDPDNRAPNRATKVLPFQVPPTAFKEHSFYLLSRDPHVIDFNDEIGLQLDVYYPVNDKITLNLNASQASRINKWEGTFGAWNIAESNDFLPSVDREYSPWYEVYADVEWYFDGQSFLRFALNKRFDSPYDEPSNFSHVIRSFTVPIQVEYLLDDVHSIAASFEQQWFYDSVIPDKPNYYNQYISLTYATAPLWTVSVRMEYTTDETLTSTPGGTESSTSIISGQNFWRAIEVSYRLAEAHTMALSYGNERGGIVCSNGICRNVLPFNGVRFMLLTQL